MKDKGDFVATFSMDNKVEDASNSKLYSVLALRLQHDGVLSQIMSRLSDGKTDKPLVALTDPVLNFGMFYLLLPAHREYGVPARRGHSQTFCGDCEKRSF